MELRHVQMDTTLDRWNLRENSTASSYATIKRRKADLLFCCEDVREDIAAKFMLGRVLKQARKLCVAGCCRMGW
jgi:hypothetical protein